jgi:hypothetical protein
MRGLWQAPQFSVAGQLESAAVAPLEAPALVAPLQAAVLALRPAPLLLVARET